MKLAYVSNCDLSCEKIRLNEIIKYQWDNDMVYFGSLDVINQQ